MKLPFLFGAATSSHQVEGGNDRNDWSEWERAGNVDGKVLSGAACDHWNRYEEDLLLAKKIGLNSYRFSVEWSRIEPDEGQWNEVALRHYEKIIDICESLGLIPMLTLHHFTNPLWFAREGGFTNPLSPKRFARFVEKIVERLGERIPLWITFNEPMVYCVGAFVAGFMPPGKKDFHALRMAIPNILRSHVLAYDLIHSIKNVSVGVANHIQDFHPARAWHPHEILISHFLDRFFNQAWIDAQLGKKPRFHVPGLFKEVETVLEARGRKTCDFIGINFYNRADVHWKPKFKGEGVREDLPFGITFAREGEKVSQVGWASHPEGLYRILKKVSRHGLPVYVTENGIADPEDSMRVEFIRDHLAVLKRVTEEKVCDLRGYFHWSLLDNFEWVKGFGPRFGLIEVDYATQARSLRKSALEYRSFITQNQD